MVIDHEPSPFNRKVTLRCDLWFLSRFLFPTFLSTKYVQWKVKIHIVSKFWPLEYWHFTLCTTHVTYKKLNDPYWTFADLCPHSNFTLYGRSGRTVIVTRFGETVGHVISSSLKNILMRKYFIKFTKWTSSDRCVTYWPLSKLHCHKD